MCFKAFFFLKASYSFMIKHQDQVWLLVCWTRRSSVQSPVGLTSVLLWGLIEVFGALIASIDTLNPDVFSSYL